MNIHRRKKICPECGRFADILKQTEMRTLYKCSHCGHRFMRVESLPAQEPPNTDPAFFIWSHQDKADALIAALTPKYAQSNSYLQRGLKFMLTDSDIRGRAHQMNAARKYGCHAFFIYPHSAPPSLINAHFRGWQYTTAQFVVNEYHAETLRQFGYKKPLESMGWYLSEIKPFKPRTVGNVLFAPIHPMNAPQDREVNASAFKKLYELSRQGAFELMVRHVGSLGENGLEHAPGVTYIRGEKSRNAPELERADVVVSHQTFAWRAVALGIPTVMMREDMPRHYKNPRANWEFMDRALWERVLPHFRFPYDILDGSDTMTLLRRAAESDADIADWKRRMIGYPFNPDLFLQNVEKYL